MLTHFDHVTIAVSQLAPAVGSYEQLLGAAPTWRGGHPELGTEAALFGLSNALVELVAPRAGAAEAEGLRSALALRGEALSALAFGTDDASAASLALRERGVRVTQPQDGEAMGADGRARHYRLLELGARSTRGLPVFVVQRSDFASLAQPPLTAAGTAGAIDALDHVVVRTADIAAALELYGRGLGLRLALDRELFGTRMLFFRVGGVTLEVIHDPTLGDNDALWGVAYRTHDLPAAHARLRAAGLPVSELREGRKPGTRVFSVSGGVCGVPTLLLSEPSRLRSGQSAER
ncbi:MAG TPA: VOC family protein [Polyangiales bacterium]